MGLTRINAGQISNIDYKQAVRVITLSNINLSAGAPTVVDGVTLALSNRILVAGQDTTSQNGIYYVTTLGTGANGTWSRTMDADATGEIAAGMIVMVTEGTNYKDSQWVLTTNNPIVIGTTALIFAQNSAFAFGNVYANSTAVVATTAGDTLTLTAGTNIQITGNISAKSVTIGVTGLSLNSISNGTSNVNVVSSGGNVTVGVAGTPNVVVFSSSGANIAGTLGVTGNITSGNLQGTTVSGTTGTFTANVTTGNISGTTGTFTNVGGALTTAAQTNITSVGTLGSLAVTGNITSGNVQGTTHSGTTGTFTGNVTTGNVSGTTGTFTNVGGTLTTAAQTSITSVGTLTALTLSGNVNMSSKNINNLLDPVSNQDAATKYYVDLVAQGLHIHTSVYVATTGTLATATAGTVTYNNGASGVGANLVTTGTYLLIDGSNVQTVGTRILVKNEANAALNGVYTYSNTTVIVRAADFDNPADVAGGDFLFVNSGSTQADTSWVQTTDAPITFGTSAIVFAQFSGAGTYQAGTGLTLTGQVFSVNASQTQITSVGTLTSLAVTGNATVGNISATNLGNISSINLTGNSSNVLYGNGVFAAASGGSGTPGGLNTYVQFNDASTFGGNASFTYNKATNTLTAGNIGGTLTTAAQTNITSVGTLSSLAVTGNITSGNLSGTSIVGTLTTAAQTNITSVGTLGSLAVTGNISGANLTGTHYGAATGLTSIPGANVTGTVNNSTYFNTVSSVTFAEALRSNRNINGGGTISVDGSGYVGWTSRYIVISNGNGTNFSTSGYFDITQPIVGTITGVGGASNTTATAAGIQLTAWQALYYILPIGSNSSSLNANFRVAAYAGALDIPHDWVLICVVNGDNNRYYFNNGITLTAGTSYATATYSSTLVPVASSATTAGTVTTAAQPNITSVGTLTSLAVTGNITSGNVQGTTHSGTTGTFTGNVNTANIAATSTISSVTVIASGNVTGGNLITPGLVSVTGNVNIGNATGVTWANTSGARVWTYYNNAASSLDTVFL